MSNYPVGATWEIKEAEGPNCEYKIGKIVLQERDDVMEVWIASWHYSDGSAPFGASDWFTNYQKARYFLCFNGRAKRVK